MSRRVVVVFLVAYFALLLAGALLRIDRFPLTWVPMYSIVRPRMSDSYKVHLSKRSVADRGFEALHRDGSTSRVSRRDLNIPSRNMWRLYYERAFRVAPPGHRHANRRLSPWERRLWGLAPGEPAVRADWEWRLLRSVNKTLGYDPDDPRFIVRLEARRETLRFDTSDLALERRTQERAVLAWKEEWRERW